MKCKAYFKKAKAESSAFTLPRLCSAYGLPRDLTGGNHIAIIELGGTAAHDDMVSFCQAVGMPFPNIVNPNSPFASDPEGANYEVALDQQVAAFVSWYCTGKVPTIEMIWDETGNIYPGIKTASSSKADVCSISWGAAENEWSASDVSELEEACWNAAASGMAVLAASGDNDYTDGETGVHVDLPSACHAVVGCSGTTKTSSSEVCWNNGSGEGTGGGFSSIWKRPKWQYGTPKGNPINWSRAVGDVSANADPNTGYEIFVNNTRSVIGGTSAVAPFWSALLAAIKSQPGFVNWQLYSKRAECFTAITQGDNGKWPAMICNGLGAPNGSTIRGLLSYV